MSRAHARARRQRGAELDAKNRRRRVWARNVATLRRLARAFAGAAFAAKGFTAALQDYARAYAG